MPEEKQHRLRLRLPGGAEFEAEGSPEFVHRERLDFTNAFHRSQDLPQDTATLATAGETPAGAFNIAWEAITEFRGRQIHLRAKLPGGKSEKDACLVLLAASHKLLSQPKPTAAQLAKWLRSSGYPILRMDRALQDGVARGEILSSGSRRARRYELTGPGRVKAILLAEQLTALITGKSS